MKKENKKEIVNKNKHKNYDKGQIFVKVMAAILAILMVGAACSSLVYALLV